MRKKKTVRVSNKQIMGDLKFLREHVTVVASANETQIKQIMRDLKNLSDHVDLVASANETQIKQLTDAIQAIIARLNSLEEPSGRRAVNVDKAIAAKHFTVEVNELRERNDALARAARRVIDCWESGDLAQAVRDLDDVVIS